jgi:hypothetical protein
VGEKLKLGDWLSDAEFSWRQKLKPASLVVEADFTADEIDTARTRWGMAARALLKRDVTPRQIVERYPALTLLVLVGHASLYYEEGKFWDSFWADVGLDRDHDFENLLRHSITDLLTKFSLARFPEVELEHGSKYVMVLALHAGMPRHSLRDLLVMIDAHIVQGRPANGASLLAWLDEPGKSHRTNSLDVPVRNFLKHGAEFAVDILDRIIEFVIAVTDEPTLLDLTLDSSTTGLPDVLLRELITQLRNKPVRWAQQSSGGTVGKRPFLGFDFDDDEIYVGLPYPLSGGEEPWRVSIDGDVRGVHAARQWGSSTEASVTRAVIQVPAREVVVAHGRSDTSAIFGLVNETDPLLTFNDKGQWIPKRDGLKDAAWIVYPDGHQPIDAVTGHPIDLQSEGMPAGWRGWRSAFVELDDVEALQLQRGERRVGTVRLVRKDARPRFILEDPTPGLRSADGRDVYARRPEVLLPMSRSDIPQYWRVRTRRLGSAELIVDCSWAAEDVEVALDPFDDDEEPQLGLFEIIVTGPLGADSRLVVFLAEDLWVEFDSAIRIPQGNGLTACTAEVGAHLLEVLPSGVIRFEAHQVDKAIDVTSSRHFERLFLVPPCIEVRSGEVGAPAPWRVTAPLATPEDLTLDRFAAVRAPGVELEAFVFIGSSGNVIQIGTQPRRRPGNVYELKTQQFADSARIQQAGRIVARLTAEKDSTEVTVLSIQPKRLGSDVTLHDDVLDFGDVGIPGLSAYLWCATAPWLPPEVFPVMSGQVKLPERLLEAGELRCQLFVDDPWVVVEPPRHPPAEVLRVDQDGWYEAGTPVQTRISRFLAGVGGLPASVGAVPEAWTALAQVHADERTDRIEWLVPVLVEDPRTSLESLGNSSIPLRDKMAMLVLSELVNRSYAAEFTLNALHADPWFGCMTEFSDLPKLFYRKDEAADERAETIGYLADRGGPTLTALLRTGDIAPFADACFDDAIFAMANTPVAEVIQIVRDRALLPRPLLDRERRRVGCYEAFLQRYAWMDSGWSANFAAQLEFVVKPIKKASPAAFDAIMARNARLKGVDVDTHPWMLMSVHSLTLASLARLEACGRVDGTYLNKGLIAVWTRLAELCPTMVSTDLLMAEALILHDRRGDLIGDEE